MNKTFSFIVLFTLFFSCKKQHNKSEIEAAMNHYDRLIQKLDADSIALLYTPDGHLGNQAIGRDSIRKFLASFKNVQVLSQKSISSFIDIKGDSALQKGTYQQTDVISNKDTIKVKGEFTTNWQWLSADGWHIKKMETKAK